MARVLVIDDDASLRFTLEAVLSDAGFQVDLAHGAKEGHPHNPILESKV